MVPVNLVLSLKREIEDAVKDYKLMAENQEDRPVTVFAQHIKDEEFNDEEGRYYPLVIVGLQGVKDDLREERSIATIGLTFGTYADDKDGWMDLLNIMEHVRQKVLTVRTVDKRYQLAEVAEWSAIEAQPYPFWFGYGTLRYTVAHPRERFPMEFHDVMEEY